MHQLSRLLLSGLVALSLTFAAIPAHASWSVSIQNVMDLVYCLVGSGDCAGLAPASTVDITTDNVDAFEVGVTALYAAGFNDGAASESCSACADITSNDAEVIAAAMPACDFEGGEVWDGSTCATPESSDPAPNCHLMGMCGQDGAAQDGVVGQYSQMSVSDAASVSPACQDLFGEGSIYWFYFASFDLSYLCM